MLTTNVELTKPKILMPFDTSALPEIPGGWQTRSIDVGGRQIELFLPADPDAFLDDEDVLQKAESTDYMPYWAHLWPVAQQMACFVFEHDWEHRTRTLELGAGVGLVGLAGLANGLHVTFSDYDDIAIRVVLQTALMNGLSNADSLWLDWRDVSANVEPFQLVLGCEVIYEPGNHPVILDVLDRLLASDGQCWIGDPGRQYSPAFRKMAIERGYQVDVLSMRGRLLPDVNAAADLPISQPRLLKLYRS